LEKSDAAHRQHGPEVTAHRGVVAEDQALLLLAAIVDELGLIADDRGGAAAAQQRRFIAQEHVARAHSELARQRHLERLAAVVFAGAQPVVEESGTLARLECPLRPAWGKVIDLLAQARRGEGEYEAHP